MTPRKVAVVTGSRSEYGILYWLLKELQDRPEIELQLMVTGAHLSPEFGMTVEQIEKDGFPIAERLEILLSADTSTAISASIGLGIISFSSAFERLKPDVLILIGDRYESLAAATAALVAKIPIGHIGGGHTTEGAIDESIRHSISKMSYFHFVSREEHRQRVLQLGEHPSRVFLTNTPIVDGITRMRQMTKSEVEIELGTTLSPQVLLVAYHPVTLEDSTSESQIDHLIDALSFHDKQCIFIMPNADTNGRIIAERINKFVASRPESQAFINLRRELYLNLLRFVNVLVGNSSSGILEAPSFNLPVVNVGDRQKGRIQAVNIIDSDTDTQSISDAISKALSAQFRKALEFDLGTSGPEDSSKQIVDILERTEFHRELLKKEFYDINLLSPTAIMPKIGG